MRRNWMLVSVFLIVGVVLVFRGLLSCSDPYLDRPVENATDLVPNVVHFIRFGRTPMTFVEAVCVLAALKNQKPSKVMIHTDQPKLPGGKYWEAVKAVGGARISVAYRERPTHIFGRPFPFKWRYHHAGDVARLEVLMEFGGIYLDSDSYIVKSLDEYRRFEMTLSWPKGADHIQNQVIIAHKDARFLSVWLDSYRNYNPDDWNYNAQKTPMEILAEHPNLINRVTDELLPPNWLAVFPMIYLEKSNAWCQYHAIHFFVNHQYMIENKTLSDTAKYPVKFDEENIVKYDANIKYMALDVWPNRTANLPNFTDRK